MLKGIPAILSPALLKALCEMGHGNFSCQSIGKDVEGQISTEKLYVLTSIQKAVYDTIYQLEVWKGHVATGTGEMALWTPRFGAHCYK